MNKRYTLAALSVVFTLFLFQVHSLALTVDKIGALDLGGKMYPEWWYTGTGPTISGTADENSTVTVNYDDEDHTTSADGSGNWSYWLNGESKDYALTFTQGGNKVSFTLHLGQGLPENLGGTTETTESTTPVPETGINQMVAIGFGLGVILLATYLYIWGDSSKRLTFEKRFLSED